MDFNGETAIIEMGVPIFDLEYMRKSDKFPNDRFRIYPLIRKNKSV
jgi:hypothetical protein